MRLGGMVRAGWSLFGRRLERRGIGAPLILGSVLRGVGTPAAARAFARSRANAVSPPRSE